MALGLSTNTKHAQRKIIHIDMDCFFAAVEVRENPQLRGQAVSVGGSPQSRGVVAACNYEARQYGIHSAMPMGQALKKCPSLITLPVNMRLYKSVSVNIHSIFKDYTDLIEPLSLDEAYLDVTHATHCHGSATLIAQEIRQRIFETEQLTASAGIASNKFLAKVASDWHKPNGQKVILPHEVSDFVKKLPVSAISGVGKVTFKKMEAHGIHTCGDLQTMTLEQLEQLFGRFGVNLYDYARGIDHRAVKPHRIRQSLSVENTFPQDLSSLESCLDVAPTIYHELLIRLDKAKRKQRLNPKGLFVKLKFNDFQTTTIQARGNQSSFPAYLSLLTQAWHRRKRPVRLIGMGLQFYPPEMPEQLVLI